ncbi:hypothetical protein F6X40_10555 [Paraburkholderia sp. UCT31]|uniref:hypothetical protein n=1 Tax=Paraburkholderia sp. UCT31 TaxID=2615209 RepID=UPI00165613AF|nr:hypothetical protein [Paraburkholderia sp. UCT31]MBC8737248.1 hypothetical protein [Paraburkholderia sp. UCT31]
MPFIDVPAYVVNPPVIDQHVRIEGGTNWDLSRSAVATPVYPVLDPLPVRADSDLSLNRARLGMVVRFAPNSARLPADFHKALKQLPTHAQFIVKGVKSQKEKAGVSNARQRAVEDALTKAGFTISSGEGYVLRESSVSKDSASKAEVFITEN